MTREEWFAVLQRMRGLWPHARLGESEKATLAAWYDTLRDQDARQVMAAVESMYRDGEDFAAGGGKIAARLAELLVDAPDWGVVKAALLRTGDVDPRDTHHGPCPHDECDGSGFTERERTTVYAVLDRTEGKVERQERAEAVAVACRCWHERRDRARTLNVKHPLVAEFLRLVGPAEVRDVLAGDRTAEAQARQKYEAFCRERRRAVAYQGMDTAGLPALERLAAHLALTSPVHGELPERTS